MGTVHSFKWNAVIDTQFLSAEKEDIPAGAGLQWLGGGQSPRGVRRAG